MAGIPHSCSEPWPSCHTIVSTPHAAATLITFSTIALSGSTIERNARASSTNVISPMSRIISGKLP